jgi:hypothetical protein
METATVEEQLAKVRHQVEALEAKGRASTGEAKSRIQRQLGALRQQEASMGAAAEQRADTFDEKLEQFEARLRVAQSAVTADLSDDRKQFAAAVEDELHNWDTYFERLQAQAAMRAASAREQAEGAISDLRKRRNVVAEHLGDVRPTAAESWSEQKERIGAARDELQRKADDLSATFK